MYIEKADKMTFVQRRCVFNVDEIDTWCQFHQHFTQGFYARRSQKGKKIQLSHQYLFTLLGSARIKAVRRTLMKLRLERRRKGQHKYSKFSLFVLMEVDKLLRTNFETWKNILQHI